MRLAEKLDWKGLIILAILYTLNYVHYEVFFGPDNNHSDLRALNGLLSKQQQGQHLTKERTTSTFLVTDCSKAVYYFMSHNL